MAAQVSSGGTVVVQAEVGPSLNSSQMACEGRGLVGTKNGRLGKEGVFLSASCQSTPVERRGATVGGLLWLLWVVLLSKVTQCFPGLSQKRRCPLPPPFFCRLH